MALTREQSQTRYVVDAFQTSQPHRDLSSKTRQSPPNITTTNFKIHNAKTASRFLAIILPSLTLCTHTLLALSFALPGNEQRTVYWSLGYNVAASGASVLGLVGAVRVSRRYPLHPNPHLSRQTLQRKLLKKKHANVFLPAPPRPPFPLHPLPHPHPLLRHSRPPKHPAPLAPDLNPQSRHSLLAHRRIQPVSRH